MAKPTSGPWQVMHDFDREGRTTVIGNVDGEILTNGPQFSYEFVATTADLNGDITAKLTEAANARLIAAAPDLLEALNNLIRQRNHKAGSVEGAMHLWDDALATIARATGEQP